MTEYHIHQTISKQQNVCDNVQASHLSKKYVISSNTKKINDSTKRGGGSLKGEGVGRKTNLEQREYIPLPSSQLSEGFQHPLDGQPSSHTPSSPTRGRLFNKINNNNWKANNK